jgi:hypothetical protein
VLTVVIQALLGLGLVLFVLRRDWENVVLTALVILLTLMPAFVWKRYRIFIPPEFQLSAAVFVFLSLFLGSAIDFYYHFWWWDIVLHTGSGFLFGIVGFIATFVLNQTEHLPQGIRRGFVCFFGVTFAVFLGVLWEIFEFLMDRFTPFNMQSLETGVDDTMQDLIVDTLGAVIVALMALAYFRTGRYSFVVDAVRGFVRKNPNLFRRPREAPKPGGEGTPGPPAHGEPDRGSSQLSPSPAQPGPGRPAQAKSPATAEESMSPGRDLAKDQ